MEDLKEQLNNLVGLMGFTDFTVDLDPESKHFSININDVIINPSRLPGFVLNMNRVVRLMTKKMDVNPVVVDINNYRKERERLILELARAAARRAVATKEPVHLPTMNAYERRLIHSELSMRPDVATESVGEGKDRYVIVKAI